MELGSWQYHKLQLISFQKFCKPFSPSSDLIVQTYNCTILKTEIINTQAASLHDEVSRILLLSVLLRLFHVLHLCAGNSVQLMLLCVSCQSLIHCRHIGSLEPLLAKLFTSWKWTNATDLGMDLLLLLLLFLTLQYFSLPLIAFALP